MAFLRRSDLHGALGFLREAEAVTGPDAFPTELLDRLRGLVESEWVSYCELDRLAEQILFAEGCSRAHERDGVTLGDDAERIFWSVIRQSPIYAYHDRTHDFSPCKLSDFLTLRRLRGLDVYTDFFRPAGIEYRLAVGLPAPLTHTKCFLFDRRRGDFDDRDRAVLDVLLPHLTALYAAAKARRVAAAVATGDRAAGELVVLSPSGAIDFRTATAGELLTRYFPDERDGRLPEAVDSWRRQQTARLNGDGPLPDPAEPLTVRRDRTRLVIRRLGHTLLLSEETAALTRREREIMEQLGDGQSNAEIASRLCIAPSTVRKHLENIYAKLGVRTRTAAVARVRRG